VSGPPPGPRARLIADALKTGSTYAHIADVFGVSRQRVGQVARQIGHEPERPANRRGKGTLHGEYGYRVLRCRCQTCRRANVERQKESPR
jgi:hypothetical protein